jgi:hypothetical protein
LIGFCLITNKENIRNNNFEIGQKDIKGLIIYDKKINGKMSIRIFKKNSELYKEIKLGDMSIGYISTNEIVDMSNLYFDGNEITTLLATNSPYKILLNESNNSTSRKINFLLNKKFINRVADEPKTCGLGCDQKNGMRCAEYNNGNYGCKKDEENCPEEDARSVLINSNINYFDYVEIALKLRNFRDSYLLEINGGENLINDCYNLGINLPRSFFTVSNCTELFESLENDVVPLISDLTNNPYSQNILIDNNLNIKLKSSLNRIKIHFTRQSDQDKIDNLLIKLDFYTNKTNDYITNNLYLY